jgi:hypothetical protein
VTKPVVLSLHAERAMEERQIDLAWIERTVRSPEWTAPEPLDPSLERRFATVPERGGRILRVVCGENHDTITIVTAFLDRRARRPQP